VAVTCELGEELWGSMKGSEFLGWLINCYLPKDSALRSYLVIACVRLQVLHKPATSTLIIVGNSTNMSH
jgi:hypothetical protein